MHIHSRQQQQQHQQHITSFKCKSVSVKLGRIVISVRFLVYIKIDNAVLAAKCDNFGTRNFEHNNRMSNDNNKR